MSDLREALEQAFREDFSPAVASRCDELAAAALDVFLYHESVIVGCHERWEAQARSRIRMLASGESDWDSIEDYRAAVLEAIKVGEAML